MEGQDPTNSAGMVDKRLFKGGNNLHAKMDEEYGHWYVQFESGIIPKELQQRWTSFPKCYDYVDNYYKPRKIEIKEIIDL